MAKAEFVKSVLVFEKVGESGVGVGFSQLILVSGAFLGVLAEAGVGFERLSAISEAMGVDGLEQFLAGSHDGVILDPHGVSVIADFLDDSPGSVIFGISIDVFGGRSGGLRGG